jgi:fatty-acyl-CoA synthase
MPVNNTTLFASEAVRRLPGWRVLATDPASGIVRAEARRAFPFPASDEVTVTVTPDGNGARVVIRSRSRVGKADLGENARHIRALQAAMDQRLPPAL